MNDKEFYKELWKCGTLLYTVMLSGIVLLLCSCATKSNIEYVNHDVIRYETKVQHDTLINNIHDSIYHTVFQKGDTIYDTKYIEKTMFRDRIVVKIDTFYRDSIQTQIKETTVEKIKISKLCYFSLVFCLIFFIFAIYKLIRWLH